MSRHFTAADLGELVTPTDPVVSPCGNWVAYICVQASTIADADQTSLWLVPTSGAIAPRRVTPASNASGGGASSAGGPSSPAWSPDGKSLAFMLGQQIFQYDVLNGVLNGVQGGVQGGEPTQLTDRDLGAGAPVWAPDSKTIYFAATVRHTSGDATSPRTIRSLTYKADGAGYVGDCSTQIFALTVATGHLKQITFGTRSAGKPAISPDGTKLAFCAARGADDDINQRSHAWWVDLSVPTLPVQQLGHATWVTGNLLWEPTGAAVYAMGMPHLRIGNVNLLRLAVEPSCDDEDLTATGDRNVMPGGPGYPGGTARLTDAGGVQYCVRDGGNTHVYELTKAGRMEPIFTAPAHVVAGLGHARGTTVVAVTTPESFGEIAVVTGPNELRYLTAHTNECLPDVTLYTAAPQEFQVNGTNIAGWLIRKPGLSEPAPLLLDIHGGPHNAWTGVADSMHPYHQMLAAAGWVILLVNPRGSDGYGEAFMRGTFDAWGTADFDDFIEPVHQLIAQGVADPNRLAVTGYSYGGYATCDITTKTSMFSAAIAGGLVSDLRTLLGASDQGLFLSEIEHTPQRDALGTALATTSPVTRLAHVATPTLVLHGDADLTCPVNQAENWFAGLRLRGVPTELVLYPGAAHPFIVNGRLSHRIDYSTRVIDWLNRHIGTNAPALDGDHWQHRLNELTTKYGTPGAAVGITRRTSTGWERTVAHTGVTNTATGEPVMADTIFQLGSIGKLWTATLIMQLVNEGKLDLDAPLRAVLPAFTVGSDHASDTITTRHLLTHTSGIDGDVFTDTGRGDDCVAQYVAALKDISQLFEPGNSWSYCNTGFVIAGHIVEVLRGCTWDEALHRYIIEPLGLQRTTTLPEQTARHSFAVGHVGTEPVSTFLLPRSMGPAGLISASVTDALTFAAEFLHENPTVLTAAARDLMLEPQVSLHHKCLIADAWGLGWNLQQWGSEATYNHDGATLGQTSHLRVFADTGVIVLLSVNGDHGADIALELMGEIATALTPATVPAPYDPWAVAARQGAEAQGTEAQGPEAQVVAAEVTPPQAGVYEAAGQRIDLRRTGSDTGARSNSGTGWHGTHTDTSGLLGAAKPTPITIVTTPTGLLAAKLDGQANWIPLYFETCDDHVLLHFGSRAYPLVVRHA